ncbi:MAG: sulfite exporter TauE/SafE family protein [bacterium]
MEYWKIAVLFGVGAVAGFINVMAGGGSTITLPTLIFLGLDSAMANGTNRIAIGLQNISGIISFRREGFHQFKKSFILSLFTLPGAIIGAFVAIKIDNLLFQRILGIVMIGIVISMFFIPQSRTSKKVRKGTLHEFLIYVAMFGIGFYGGFIQVGVGFLIMASFYHILNLNLIYINMHKLFIVFIYTIPALFIFIMTGNVNWGFGLSLASGNAFGAWWSAKISVKGGEKIIRIILGVTIIIMALKLFSCY